MRRSHFAALPLFAVLLLAGSTRCIASNPSITITGAESSSGGLWDHGTVTVTINSHSEMTSYGQFSTPTSIAAALAAEFSSDCSSPVNAKATGPVITFQLKSGQTGFSTPSWSAPSGDPTHFPTGSFQLDTSTLWSVTAPYILSLTPNNGAIGTVITIAGMNFGTAQSTSTVTINGTVVAPLSWDTGTIIVAVPTGVTTGNVVVTVGGTASNGVPFTVNGSSCQL